MAVEGSTEIPEEVAYGETVQRYLISRMSGKGLSGTAPGRPRKPTASGSMWERCNGRDKDVHLVVISQRSPSSEYK